MSTTIQEHRLLQALRGKPHAGVPVWFMRQAGRYLPGYQKIRARTEFLDLCKTPELAAEVTIEPLEVLGVDAVIIFSDILIPLEAMGLPVVFTDRGPCMEKPLSSAAEIEALTIPDPVAETGFVMETIRETRRRTRPFASSIPISCRCGSP